LYCMTSSTSDIKYVKLNFLKGVKNLSYSSDVLNLPNSNAILNSKKQTI
jgi:hypothetical protein